MPRPKTRDASLRTHILKESLAALEAEGPTALTARRVAASANSSTAAIYELFGDKAGLIRGLYYDGFATLRSQLEALPESDNARADLVASLGTARDFAVKMPMLHEIMYARPFIEFQPEQSDLETAAAIYRHLTALVARWLKLERRATFVTDAAHAIVATNRGLVSAEIAGLLGGSTASVLRRRTLTISALLDGLADQAALR